jgi:hypothetical protein
MKKTANTDNPLARTGDLVVGLSDPSKSVYSKTGAMLNPNGVAIYGDEGDIEAKKEMFLTSAKLQGGEAVKIVDKKVKKSRAKTTPTKVYREVEKDVEKISVTLDERQPTELKTIQFENQFGRIKAKIEHLAEEELAFMLIFTNDDMVVFEPKVGESLTLHTPDRSSFEVYYPGVMFSYPDSSKKLMILFKIPVENIE